MSKFFSRTKDKPGKNQQEQVREIPVENDLIFPDIPFSPSGFLIFLWVVFLDFLGFLFFILDFFSFGLAELFGLIPDIMGLLTLGIYEWFKMGKMPIGPKLKKYITKKSGARFIFEVLPTGFLPLWTVYAFKKSRRFPEEIRLEDAYEQA